MNNLTTNQKPVMSYLSYGREYKVHLRIESYQVNNQIALCLDDAKTGEQVSTLSVFVTPFGAQNLMAVDINNEKGSEDFIKKYCLGSHYAYTSSGFCRYPVYVMSAENLKKYDPKGLQRLIDTEFKMDELF